MTNNKKLKTTARNYANTHGVSYSEALKHVYNPSKEFEYSLTVENYATFIEGNQAMDYLIAGATMSGKTIFARNLAYELLSLGRKVLWVSSYPVTHEEWLFRIMEEKPFSFKRINEMELSQALLNEFDYVFYDELAPFSSINPLLKDLKNKLVIITHALAQDSAEEVMKTWSNQKPYSVLFLHSQSFIAYSLHKDIAVAKPLSPHGQVVSVSSSQEGEGKTTTSFVKGIKQGEIIAITSVGGGVGKTTNALALAEDLAIANPEKSVLIVDFDVRDGQLQFKTRADRVVHPDNIVLEGLNKSSIGKYIVKTDENRPDFFLSPKNRKIFNNEPKEFYHELLSILASMYDYVIVDAATSYLEHAEAPAIYSLADKIFLIVRKKGEIEQAKAYYAQAEVDFGFKDIYSKVEVVESSIHQLIKFNNMN